MRMKQGVVLIGVLVFSIAALTSFSIPQSAQSNQKSYKISEIYKSYNIDTKRPVYLEINEIVSNNKEAYIKFYTDLVGDQFIAETIMNESLKQGVAVNLSFSLAFNESRFDPKAINENIDEYRLVSSIDRGLFQLNSIVYKDYTEEQLLDVRRNVKLGIAHLKSSLDDFDSISSGLMSYNAGSYAVQVNTVLRRTRQYARDIMTMQDKLDTDVNSYFADCVASQVLVAYFK